MSAIDTRVLFERRPGAATFGLALASASGVATLFQGLGMLLGLSTFYFDFGYVTSAQASDVPAGARTPLLSITWSLLLLIACYRALAPRPGARYAVAGLIGLKFIAFATTTSDMSALAYLGNLAFAGLPIALLVSRRSNRFYGTSV